MKNVSIYANIYMAMYENVREIENWLLVTGNVASPLIIEISCNFSGFGLLPIKDY